MAGRRHFLVSVTGLTALLLVSACTASPQAASTVTVTSAGPGSTATVTSAGVNSTVTVTGSATADPTTSSAPSTASTTAATATSASTVTTGPEHFTPLIITEIAPGPIPVTGTDQKVHLVYELEVLNAAPRPATLTKVETLDGANPAKSLGVMTGDQIVARSILVGDYALPPVPATSIPAGRSLLLVMDAQFASRAAVPSSLIHRITASYGKFDPDQGDFALNNFPAESTELGGPTAVQKAEPEVIGPPLEGDGWVAVNACCDLSPHRGAMLPLAGRINGAERYAVDFSKFDLSARPIVDLQKQQQATFKGDPTKNENYFAFGQPLLAVTDGEVVTVVKDLPEAPPHVFLKDLGVGELGGNHIVLKIRDGVYAFYAHMKTGSATVKVGDHVTRGQVIGELGNSGNTSEAHLHFGVMDGPLPLTATNLPWEIDHFVYDGDVTPEQLTPTGAGARTDELPLIYGALKFPDKS